MLTPDATEPLLQSLAGTVRFLLELLSVGAVVVGLVATARQVVLAVGRRRSSLRPSAGARLTFGSWLSMALEFQLGADIVATTTAPSGANLLQLGAVALIRTFLNVFLARELEAEAKLERQISGPSPP